MPTVHVRPGSALELQKIADTLGRSRKVVVITGAGISTNCGIPDFRSEDGLYSLIQAQYDAAVQNPPWQNANTFDIDDRPKKKRKSWYYEVVAPDGEVVDVIDEEISTGEPKQESRHSSRSRSASSANSRSSTPTANFTDASSVSGPPSVKLESLSENTPKETIPADPKPPSRRSSRRLQDSPAKPSGTSDKSQPSPSKQPQIASSRSTSTSTTPLTNSRPPSRANSLRRKSAANVLTTITNSTQKDPPLTRTRILQREESSVLTTSFEDDEPSGTQSSQSSRTSLPNLKGRDLFDSMVWTDAFTTSIFYMFISSLRQKIQNEVKSTTETHKFIKVLRDGGRLVRNYTQNIDSLEEREGLCTDLTRGPGNRARFHSKTQREPRPLEIDSESAHSGGVEVVLLHGSLVNLRCGICTKLSSWDEAERESATLSGQAPDCPSCTEYNTKRTGNGRRGLAVGRLRPDIVLYGEEHPHANLVSPLITHDLGLGPDVLLIMGTSLKVHGLKVMVKEFAKAVHTRGGKVVFVNRTKPPESIWGDVIDYWVEWDCDTWVLDLKERREDIWLPQGAIEEKRKESPGDTKQSSKKMSRPQCTRDDKMNGIYMTFKILDTLRNATDEKGKPATRFTYWERTSRVSNVSDMQIEVERKPTPAKRAARKSEPIKKATKSQPAPKAALSASKKRKSYPTCLRDDKYNMAHLTTTIWQNLRLAYPGLSETPPEISHPILQERCLNIPSTTQKFAFNGESNHLPNVGWGIENFNLVTHPPSGASMPVHTPKRVERKPNNHSHATRLSSRFSENTIVVDVPSENHEMEKEHTIVVETEKVETDVKEGDEENSMPTPPGSDPMTPSSSRIKRIGSISAILSSDTEEGSEEWHDAPEVMT